MARKRDISPELWENQQLARVQRDARLLFVGCISQADDEGRLVDSVPYLKSKVFAFDDGLKSATVKDWLEALIEQELICRYQAGSESYLHLPSWRRWQTINRAYPSRLPPCPKHAPSPGEPSPPDHPPLTEHSLNGSGALIPRAQAVTVTGTGPVTGPGPGDTAAPASGADPDAVQRVYDHFKATIQPRSRTFPRKKIAARLKTFAEAELIEGLSRFRQHPWWYEHNRGRPAEWFFESDARSEQLLLLEPERAATSNVTQLRPTGTHGAVPSQAERLRRGVVHV